MAIFTKEFILHEKYVSKYAKYLDNYDDKMKEKEDDDYEEDEEDDDDEEEDDDDDEKSDSNKSKDTKSSSNVNIGKKIAIGGNMTDTTQATVLYIPLIKSSVINVGTCKILNMYNNLSCM